MISISLLFLIHIVIAWTSKTQNFWTTKFTQNIFTYDPFPQFKPYLTEFNMKSSNPCILSKTHYLNTFTEWSCFPNHIVPKLQPHASIPIKNLDAICSNGTSGHNSCGNILLDWTKRVYKNCQLDSNPILTKSTQMYIYNFLYSQDILRSFCSKDSNTGDYCLHYLTANAAIPGATLLQKEQAYCSPCGKSLYKGYIATEERIGDGTDAIRTKMMVEALCGVGFLS